jgi:lipopolysaccharide assembly outer membrane protein LptD (OstA)
MAIFFSVNKLYGQTDTLSISQSDTITISQSDTLPKSSSDTLPKSSSKKLSPNAVQSSIRYISQDSIIINLATKKIFLFEDAKAYYEDIELDAAFMEFGFVNSDLYASGIADSCGHIRGSPLFKPGDGTEYCSQEIRYNFKSKKVKVTKVITNEGEGYIHGHYVKHVDEKTSYIKGGQYTTCNLEHPHFQIRFSKAKLIQDDKIVIGPAYMSFGDVPTPLVIPFGLFPLNKDRASGIIMPKYGEGTQRGFYFEDFGYYFGINDKIDLSLLGYITTRGSWGVAMRSNYALRYKCYGETELGFRQNFYGERKVNQSHENDYRIFWKHAQDPKSHPTTRFSAHIDVRTPNYNRNNPTPTGEYLSNQFNSSLNVSTNAKGIFFFDAGINYDQNTSNKNINMSLPDVNMSVRQFYPFRKKYAAGKLKWYDNITLQWSSQMANKMSTKDTLFFKPETWQELQSGIQHNIPLNIPIKVGKTLNWNTSATLREKWYLQRNEQIFVTDTAENGNVYKAPPVYIFQRGFYALHDVNVTTYLTTKIFWDYGFKKGGLIAIRHVMSPDLRFSYIPNLSGNTYGTYFNTITGEEQEYSYFETAMYGNVASRMQAVARFAVSNSLEMKVRSKKDTITGTKKITIFDNVTVATSYDFAADSLRWKPLTIDGRTSIFSFLDITFRLGFDPYIIGENGRNINQREFVVNKRLMRFSGSNLNFGVNWHINQDFFKKMRKKEKQTNDPLQQSENGLAASAHRPDFSTPWSIIVNYTFSITTSDNDAYYRLIANNKYENTIIHTINVVADINITRKWKIGATTHFDIKNKKFSYTKIDIYRDLHCWEMRLGWIPMGGQKGWNFQINVKASVLQDLKYKIENDFRDNY